jgi:hypothetical protein
MKTCSSFPSLTLSRAFEQFLENSSFAWRTRESYTEDLAPLFAECGQMPVTALKAEGVQAFLALQESLVPATYNRRLAALRSFTRWLRAQGWLTEAFLDGIERKLEGKRAARALDAELLESVLRKIADPRDRALIWLIYDDGLRCQEALAIDIDDICWPERSIRIGRPVCLDGPISPPTATHASRNGRLTRSGKAIPPTGIFTNCATRRSACALPMITPKPISNALADIPPCAAWNATSPITARPPNAKRVSGNVASVSANVRKEALPCQLGLRPASPCLTSAKDGKTITGAKT